jgi:hypothetical protein
MRSALHRLLSPVSGDRGGIVIGWLTKLTVALALVGVVLFDAISVGSTRATVADDGSYAAHQAADTWADTKDIQQAYASASAAAAEANPANVVSTKGFTVDPDGTVHLVISRTAHTMILFRWDRTAKWAVVRTTAEGRSVA